MNAVESSFSVKGHTRRFFRPVLCDTLKGERLTTPPLRGRPERTMPQTGWNNRPENKVGKSKYESFETTVLPYLNSAYNLARWLTRNEHDAEDIVQEAFLRALRSFDTFTVGRDARAWLLTIVRNCCRTWHRQSRSHEATVEWDVDSQPAVATWSDPEAMLIKGADSDRIRQAMERLPFEYREILILRELEELSYREIALVVDIPLGTVMSRLSRARKELYIRLCQQAGEVAR
jgi:RNA polymerase sigma factor (sigma-70 family)